MCQNQFFVGAPSKNIWQECLKSETPCVNGYKIITKIPCAACRAGRSASRLPRPAFL